MLIEPIRRSVAFVGAVALGLGLSIVGCGGDDDTTSMSTTVTATESTTTTGAATTAAPAAATTAAPAAATTAAPAAATLVSVYWGWTVLNPPAGSPERIGAGAREVAADTPVRNALDAMFDGPNPLEQSIGMTTSIPPGTAVLGIAVDGTVATVDLSAGFAASSGSLDEMMRLAQVVFAVTQFDDIDRVKFQIDGVSQDPILSHGFEVGDGLTRDDFENVRPTILIEHPYPGADVSESLVIRGESNTFEGTVRYAITSGGGDGLVVIEGFTTSTSGNGIWGDFEVIVDLSGAGSGYEPGPGSVIMWEDSALDGTRLGVVEIPVVLPEL
ncbi:MAG: GerMN domain-containing protein [Ilumatobacteraceae bacterium]